MDIGLLIQSFLYAIGYLLGLVLLLAGLLYVVSRFIDDFFAVVSFVIVLIAVLGLTIVIYIEQSGGM